MLSFRMCVRNCSSSGRKNWHSSNVYIKELHFSEVHEGCHVEFEMNPWHSSVHERQKNEFHLIFTFYNN